MKTASSGTLKPMVLEVENNQWLKWARELAALAQSGLAYQTNPFEVERYQKVRAVAAEMTAALFSTTPQKIQDVFEAQCGYATPKLDVRAVVLKDQQLLMVQETADGQWTLPGGWVDVGESPSSAVAREAREESGYLVRPTRLLAVYDRDRHEYPPHPFQIYKLFFLCELCGGEASPSVETCAVRFFTRDEISILKLGKVNATDLTRIFALAQDPGFPADFD